MRPVLLPVSLLALIFVTACGGDDNKVPPKEAIASGCHAFTQALSSLETRRATAQTALTAAHDGLSKAVTAASLQSLTAAEAAATKAEVEYARSPDISLVAVARAAESESKYQPVLVAFLSGDIDKAKAACAPY
jgi:hypothetical protein